MATFTLNQLAPDIKYSKEGEPVLVRYRFPFLDLNAQIGDTVQTPYIDPFDLLDGAGNHLPHAIEAYLLWQFTSNYTNVRTIQAQDPIINLFYNQPVIHTNIINSIYNSSAGNVAYYRITDFFAPFRMLTQIATVAPDERNFMEMNFKLKGFI